MMQPMEFPCSRPEDRTSPRPDGNFGELLGSLGPAKPVPFLESNDDPSWLEYEDEGYSSQLTFFSDQSLVDPLSQEVDLEYIFMPDDPLTWVSHTPSGVSGADGECLPIWVGERSEDAQ